MSPFKRKLRNSTTRRANSMGAGRPGAFHRRLNLMLVTSCRAACVELVEAFAACGRAQFFYAADEQHHREVFEKKPGMKTRQPVQDAPLNILKNEHALKPLA